MLIRVRVTANTRESRVSKTGEDSFEVRVDVQAVRGRANRRLREILAEYFNVPKSRVTVVRGAQSRDKIVEIQSVNRTTSR